MNPFSSLYLAYLRLKNSLDYPLRQRLSFNPKPVIHSRPNTQEILSSYPPGDRNGVKQVLSRLDELYHFQYFTGTHTLDEIKENYYYLSMLDEAFQRTDITFRESIHAADIGPSSWFYVHALSAVLAWFNCESRRDCHISGFEIDANRLYADFHTRRDHALGNMQGLQGVEFFDHGFEQGSQTYDFITMFFPFVFEKDHLKWGLPTRLFDPTTLLKTVWNSLRPGGMLLIVNQGIEEHIMQLSFLEKLNIPVTAAFKVEPLLYSYTLDRYIITAVQND